MEHNNVILEKPTDETDAARMLGLLSNDWHRVHTGVVVFLKSSSGHVTPAVSFNKISHVKFANLSPLDISAYIT